MEDHRRKSIFKRWWFWVLIFIILIWVIASMGGENATPNPSSNKKPSSTAPAGTNPGSPNPSTVTPSKSQITSAVTYENFMKIKMGSKLSDVEALVGKGTEESSSEMSGIKTIIYSWIGQGISNMNVTIQNNLVTGKAQAGLMEMDAKITLDKYNKINVGMTYEQVKGIIGEGQVISETKIANMESIMYQWINKNGSNMNATFTGGKLDTKAQFNLI